MKVTATQEGFFAGRLMAPGRQFEIPDAPKGKDKRPLAFSAVWMRPGWDEAPVEEAPVQSHLAPAADVKPDLNSDVI